MVGEAVTEDELTIEHGWTHLRDKGDFLGVILFMPFVCVFPTLLIWFGIHPFVAIGYLIFAASGVLWVLPGTIRNWRPRIVWLSPRGITEYHASDETTIRFDGDSRIDIPHFQVEVDFPVNQNNEVRDDLLLLGEKRVYQLIEGIAFHGAEETIYLSCWAQGWRREDIEALWKMTCKVLFHNSEIAIGDGLARLIHQLRTVDNSQSD